MQIVAAASIEVDALDLFDLGDLVLLGPVDSTDRILSNRNDFHTKKKPPQNNDFDSAFELNFAYLKSHSVTKDGGQ